MLKSMSFAEFTHKNKYTNKAAFKLKLNIYFLADKSIISS